MESKISAENSLCCLLKKPSKDILPNSRLGTAYLAGKYGLRRLEQIRLLSKQIPTSLPKNQRKRVIHEKLNLPKSVADQLVTDVYAIAPKFLQHDEADDFEILCPPTDTCPNKCVVDKGKCAGQIHKLAWHRKGTKAKLFCHDGKIKNVEAPVLRCRGCGARFLYSIWKNPAAKSYQLYNKVQPYIRVTTKVFVDAMLMEDLINQMLISQTTFEGFAAYKQRLHKWPPEFTRKIVSTAFFKYYIEKELRSRNMVDYKFKGQGKLLQCIPALIQLAFSSLLTHECSDACKAKNCDLLFVLDGNWKIMFRHCAQIVTNVVSKIPLISYPNVCTNGTCGNSEFCAHHQKEQQASSPQSCELLLPGVTALIQAARNDIDRILRSESDEIQDRMCKEFNPSEICQKNKGEGQRTYHYSRGYMFMVRGTGHIEAFAPIYRAESLGQVFLFLVNWLYQYLQTIPEEKWDGIYIAYDNMCQLNRLRASKELLPLPPPYNSMWMRVQKIIDGLHIKNHKNPDCKRLYGPDKFHEQHGETAVRNTMSAEQTFSWLTRYRKQTNSMTKDNQIFCLYVLSKERNLYLSEQYKANKKVPGSSVRSYRERE